MILSTQRSAAIEFVGVSKDYGELHVVRDLSLRIDEGEFVALLGPSGCGKSTLLKLIAGIEDPSAGEIYVGGQLVNYKLPRDRDIAMVFQNYALYPHMSVEQNIAYPLTTGFRRQFPAAELADKVAKVAEVVGIQNQLHKRPEQLSGGQRQRVALARAIIREPKAFLMDEPLSNLDALLREEMRHQLAILHKRVGRATVYVTHDQLEAMTLADRIVIMNEGIVQQVGTPREVFSRPANMFVAHFVGSPAMNFVEGEVAGPEQVMLRGITPVGVETMPSAQLGEKVTIGLRPTDIVSDFGGGGSTPLAGIAEDVEYTGVDHFYTLAMPEGVRLRIRDDTREGPKVGVHRRLSVAPQHVHVFDAQGCRLNVGTGRSPA